ncbi:hypothetical protein [Burkholderia phage FLC9]|nr:hypothetical protein [Burkholderia phage FLC9]
MWDAELQRLATAVNEIEAEHKVQILHVVETGSRAQGLDNHSSDHDIGFIYVRAPEKYFQINRSHRDSKIQENRDALSIKVEGYADLTGYDISKALDMAYHSNPVICDWLRLPSLYEEECIEEVRTLMFKAYNPLKLRQLNLGTAKRNYKAYIEGKTHVPVKSYIQTVRALLNVVWYDRVPKDWGLGAHFPAYDYLTLCTAGAYDHDLLDASLTLHRLKKSGKIMTERFEQLDRIIVDYFDRKIPEGMARQSPPIELYDATFAKIALLGYGPTHSPMTNMPPWRD